MVAEPARRRCPVQRVQDRKRVSRLMWRRAQRSVPASMSSMSSPPATVSRRSREGASMPAGTGPTGASIRPATSRAGDRGGCLAARRGRRAQLLDQRRRRHRRPRRSCPRASVACRHPTSGQGRSRCRRPRGSPTGPSRHRATTSAATTSRTREPVVHRVSEASGRRPARGGDARDSSLRDGARRARLARRSDGRDEGTPPTPSPTTTAPSGPDGMERYLVRED